MRLDQLYRQAADAVAAVNFSRIWPGFRPLRFALFDDETCIFDGRRIEKTDAFCANTSIRYQGEQIATWKVIEEPEIPVLASKLVHEMFHGFQQLQGWDCWPDELEALHRYEYLAGNLSLKLRENELLLALLERFDEASFRELLAHRKLRSERFPYAFSYESQVEEIEGSANYVEWQALKQLDEEKAAALTDRMRGVMTQPEALFPIRVSSYYTGALMIHALRGAGLYSFEPAGRPVIRSVLQDVEPSDGAFTGKNECLEAVSDAIVAYQTESEAIVHSALERNEVVLTGPLELAGLNVYDARSFQEYLTSTYFLMVRDGIEERLLPGCFVIRMRDEKTIDTVYRWK